MEEVRSPTGSDKKPGRLAPVGGGQPRTGAVQWGPAHGEPAMVVATGYMPTKLAEGWWRARIVRHLLVTPFSWGQWAPWWNSAGGLRMWKSGVFPSATGREARSGRRGRGPREGVVSPLGGSSSRAPSSPLGNVCVCTEVWSTFREMQTLWGLGLMTCLGVDIWAPTTQTKEWSVPVPPDGPSASSRANTTPRSALFGILFS